MAHQVNPGNVEASVQRILHHVARLMTFSGVEWMLQERNREAVLKLNFTQDAEPDGDDDDSLSRIKNHIERLSNSHRLRDWDLRETDGHAVILVAFLYEGVKSPEDVFFMTSSHLNNPENKRKNVYRQNIIEDEKSKESVDFYATGREDMLGEPSLIEACRGKSTRTQSTNTSDGESTPQKGKNSGVVETKTKSYSFKPPYVGSKISVPISTSKSSQNPFSVSNTAPKKTSGRYRARSVKPPPSSKSGSLQRSKSTSTLLQRPKPSSTRPIADSTSHKKHVPEAPVKPSSRSSFSSSRFTFRKSYSKSSLDSKSQTSNFPVKRKTEYLDEGGACQPYNGVKEETKLVSNSKGIQAKTEGRHKSESSSTLLAKAQPSSRDTTANSKPVAKRNGEAFNDLYRLYFDNPDSSLCHNDSFVQRQVSQNDRQLSSTPLNRHNTSQGKFADLFKQSCTMSTPDKAKIDLSEVTNNTSKSTQTPVRLNLTRQKDKQALSSQCSSSGLGESHSSDTESSLGENNTHEATLTEASRTSDSSEAFSCCTEPCLDESAKDEIQNYYLKIYNQIQKDPKVETGNLIWQIDDTGRICVYHKNLKQTKVHDLVSPEQLFEVDPTGAVLPGFIKQQYVFKRLLDELDQVTFDNRALNSTEKKRLDKLLKQNNPIEN